MMKTITNKDLISTAKSAYKNAYSPYSKVKVGAALLTSEGRIYTGCNIENASYGLSICAEQTAVHNAVSNGEKKFIKIAIASNKIREFTPCGACRQVLSEFSPKIKVIWLNAKGRIQSAALNRLLPRAFKKSKNRKT